MVVDVENKVVADGILSRGVAVTVVVMVVVTVVVV